MDPRPPSPIGLTASVAALLATLASGCQSLPPDGPARIDAGEAEAAAAIRSAAGVIEGRTVRDLGPGPVVGVASVTVLPAAPGPLETRSPARPEVYDIQLRAGRCLLVRRIDGASAPLESVRCVPLGQG